jgi:hypothetical protein
VPVTGVVVPFPFLIACGFFFFLVFASWLKDRRRSLFFANYLLLLGFIEPLLILTLIISSAVVGVYSSMAIFIAQYLVLIILNLTQFILFLKKT